MRKIENPLTLPRAIKQNQQGKITRQQAAAYQAHIQPKLNWWLGASLGSLLIVAAPLLGYTFPDPVTGERNAILLWIALVLALALLLPSIYLYLRWRKNSRALIDELVASGQGVVQWQGRQYRVRLDEPPHNLDCAFSPELFPGRYRFYYLPRYSWLLSAEHLHAPDAAQDLAALTLLLAQVYHFDLEALPANRMGQLAENQKAVLLRRYWLHLAREFAGVLGIAAGITLIVLWSRMEAGWLIPVLGLGVPALLLYGLLRSRRTRAAILEGRVEMTAGPVEKVTLLSQEGASGEARIVATYYLDANEHTFKVSRTGYEAVLEGVTYRFYYLPATHQLVNLEVVAVEGS